MTSPAPGRHLTTAGLQEHWDAGVPVAIPIAGTPTLRLRVDPPRSRLTLRVPLASEVEPPVNALAHVAVEVRIDGNQRFLEISTTDERLAVDGHAMLMAVADRIQLDGIEPVEALEQTLATWEAILASRVRLTVQAEVGLVGELLVLRAMLDTAAAGASAWRGGLSEEHDFGFADVDVEVKTTTSEQRRHWIHGLGQLVPTGDSPLWLLSVQLTRAGEGDGHRLPELIDDLRVRLSCADRGILDQSVAAAGWSDDQRDLVTDRWRLRTAPVAFHVADDFPRLTPDLLAAVSIDVAPLRQVTYEVELTGQPASLDPPATVATIIKDLGKGFDD
ncbi:MAG: PD-(D/E)XK motif protein [Solirubrobacteraceae bacterium]|nr:PD-(D/E)XK motif protein [Solirubrobacteraceae bacterium]